MVLVKGTVPRERPAPTAANCLRRKAVNGFTNNIIANVLPSGWFAFVPVGGPPSRKVA
jgi:hypothetical protein